MQKNIRHIYWFAHYGLNNPSTRYRGLLALEYLTKNQNIPFDFIFPEKSLKTKLKFIRIFLSALLFRKTDSLIVIQKITSGRIYARALKFLIFFRRKNTLYDIDDAEYIRNNSSSLHYFLRHCRAIVVGSEALSEYCRQFNTNVNILTTPIYSHPFLKLRPNNKLNIGWVGDPGNGNKISREFSHRRSLFELIFPPLRKLEIPFKLSLIGIDKQADILEIQNYFKACPQIELDIPTHLNWEEDEWVYSRISNFDLGLALMVDHPFNHAKSAFKAKQYLSCGVPVLASDVGENRNFVIHGLNGFICKNEEEILEYIYRLARMDDDFEAMSRNARESFTSFSLERYCKDLLNVSK